MTTRKLCQPVAPLLCTCLALAVANERQAAVHLAAVHLAAVRRLLE